MDTCRELKVGDTVYVANLATPFEGKVIKVKDNDFVEVEFLFPDSTEKEVLSLPSALLSKKEVYE